MVNVVIDTNVLVSSLISMNGSPARILDLVLNKAITPCFDSRILSEYQSVLLRPKFNFLESDVNELLSFIKLVGISVTPSPINDKFVDEADKKFFEVSTHCNAILITGNIKHFPSDETIVTPARFLELL